MGLPKLTAADQQVRAALEDILRWDEIARSGQLAKFLSYIVEAKLRGEEDAIKAYSIAVDVFGRAPSFDPQSDPIVRVQARRLRSLLEQYYNQVEDAGPVRIHLPVGRYIPEFEVVEDRAPGGDDGAGAGPLNPASVAHLLSDGELASRAGTRFGSVHITRSGWGLVALLLAGIGGAALLLSNWPSVMPGGGGAVKAPGPPRVNVLEFQNLAGGNGEKPLVGGLALELVTDLQLFEDIDVAYGQSAAEAGSNPAQAGVLAPQNFVLSGIARVTDGRVQYGVILKRNGSDAVVWSHAVTFNMAQTEEPQSIDAVSRALALMLGSHRGPLDTDTRAWLAEQAEVAQWADPYVCRLLFHIYRDSGLAADAARAQTCANAMADAEGPSGVGLAIQAALTVDAAGRGEFAADVRAASLQAASEMIATAISLSPTSSFVWEQKARQQEESGERAEAQVDYASALQLNPANDDALAGFGRMMALTPDWGLGASAALTAISGTPEPPPWYYTAPALNSMRARQFAAAIRYAETVATVDRELGPIIAVVAGIEVGNADVVNRYLPQVLEQSQFRARGILPRLAQRITDPVLMAIIKNNLVLARVPSAALNAPF